MNKVITEIKTAFPSIQVSTVELPEGNSLNDFWVNYSHEGILKLLAEQKSALKVDSSIETISAKSEIKPLKTTSVVEEQNAPSSKLIIYGGQKIGFNGMACNYNVLGDVSPEVSAMKVTLQFVEFHSLKRYTRKLDLFEYNQVQDLCVELSEKHGLNGNLLEADLMELSDLLSDYRDIQIEKANSALISNRTKQTISPAKEEEAVIFLSKKNLIERMDKLVEQTGVIGEENNRALLFVSATTYKTNPLHVIVQGSSGSGKSHLINAIKNCLPSEDVIDFTRVTSKSFYHYNGNDLVNKAIIIQDFDGLDEDAQLAFREAQSAKQLNSSTVFKDKFGNMQSQVRTVNAHFSSMVATTKAEVYFDNMSRSVIIGVDESEEQTRRIISYQNRKIAGLIDLDKEQEAKELLQNCIRILKPYKVINRFADKIELPIEAKMLRRLNEQFQLFVMQIAFLNQYQRERDEKDRIIATKEDLKLATELFFDAIYLKVDELDSSTRQFFERLKELVKKQSQDKANKFCQRDVRIALNQSKSQCFRYFEELLRLEYIAVTDGSANRGFQYKVTEWRPMKELRDKIKTELYDQIKSL